MFKHRLFLKRSFDLAKSAIIPNNLELLAGVVITYNGKIIGEGFEENLNNQGVEMNAIDKISNKQLLSQATLYYTFTHLMSDSRLNRLTEILLKHKIPKVYFGLLQPTYWSLEEKIKILTQEGIDARVEILADKHLKNAVNPYSQKNSKCPYVILKFAQSLNCKMGVVGKNVWISNPYTKRLTHKWRSEIDAIMIGTQTFLIDNPQLNNRYYFGKSPVKLILKRDGLINIEAAALHSEGKTIIISAPNANNLKNRKIHQWLIPFDEDLLKNILKNLQKEGLKSLLVEGGSTLLGRFIQQNLWDEARVFTGKTEIHDPKAIAAPNIVGNLRTSIQIYDNTLTVFDRCK